MRSRTFRAHARPFAPLLLALLGVHAGRLAAADWPVWRGPNHDGVSTEALAAPLPAEAAILWRANVGTGFSTVSVSRGRLFTMGNRDETDTVWCLDAKTGAVQWKHSYACPLDPLYYEGGPSATPTVDGDAVYTFSKKGHVFRFDFETGAIRWKRNLVEEMRLQLGEWSFASSPFLHGDLLILNAGGAGVALDRETGATAWESDTRTAGYATAVPLPRANGKTEILLFGARDLMRINPDSGKMLWSVPWETGREVNCADPVVQGNRALITSSLGAALFDFDATGGATEVWRNKNLRCYFNAPVLVDGHLYAIHGTTHRPTELVCIHWETGETLWSRPGFGSGALMAARDIGILFDKGQLTLFRLTPETFEPLLQQQILGGTCWTVPVLSNGIVYCRNAAGDLAAVDLANR